MTRLYRLLLLAYPRELREAHGLEMAAAVDAAWRRACARGPRARASFAASLLADFGRSLPGAWWPRRQSHRPSGRPGDSVMRILTRELRFAVRMLWRGRLSNGAIVLTLALAIGANAAVFSVVYAVLLKPLPYADPDRLVTLWENNVARNHDRNVVGPANFLAWQDRARSFAGMAAYIRTTANVTGDRAPEQVSEYAVSWNVFNLLGVTPAVGRAFQQAESIPNSPAAVVLGWAFWQRRYNGDAAIVGRSIVIDSQPRQVVGVLPQEFRLLGTAGDVWVPFRFNDAWREPHGRSFRALARLAPGTSLDQARAEMSTIAAALEQQWPDFDTGWRVTVVPMRDDLVGLVRLPLLLLLVAVGLVLLVGCANTANLLLARAADRRREMALRAALGASRGQLGRQLLVEGTCLAGTGMLGGLVLAELALRGISGWLGTALSVPRIDEAHLSWPVLAFSLGLMGLCAVLFSVVPAAQVNGDRLTASLVGGGRWSTGGPKERRLRQGLVVLQVALAVVLVIAGGLVTRSLIRLTAVSPGFDASRLLTFTVSTPRARYPDSRQSALFLEDAVARLRLLPGVEGASGIAFLPFAGPGIGTTFWIPGRPDPAVGQFPITEVRPIDDEYFRVMRIPIRSGRFFTHEEVVQGTHVAIVNETMVLQMFPDENPMGRPISVNLIDSLPNEIVGVVDDVKMDSLDGTTRPMVYYPYGRYPVGFMTFVLRSGVDPTALLRGATATIQERDKDLPLTEPKPMSELVRESVASPSLATILTGAFAGLALTLSLVGTGALLAASVAARRTEFSVRLALGATPGMIRRLVLSEGGRLVALGLAFGLGAAALLSRLAGDLLFNVTPTDPVIYAMTVVVVMGLTLVAADIPARRATRVDPGTLLR